MSSMAEHFFMPQETSWENVAEWYDGLLAHEGTYQKELILPNLLRLMDIRKGDEVLDLACGQGFFARAFAEKGARVIGVDASRTLIGMARKNSPPKGIELRVASADSLDSLKGGSVDKVAIVLALQNIENIAGVLRACSHVLKNVGMMYVVLNHPAFRIPKESAWGWDERAGIQYRRVDRYLSELKSEIEMHPGKKRGARTVSFHRPLQYYFKLLSKAGFAVTALEEWNSHKTSQPGPRAKAEDRARKEMPLFLCLVARKL
jgi:ubiquinone/menaquinone biosynthesis C-methylase UbiE